MQTILNLNVATNSNSLQMSSIIFLLALIVCGGKLKLALILLNDALSPMLGSLSKTMRSARRFPFLMPYGSVMLSTKCPNISKLKALAPASE